MNLSYKTKQHLINKLSKQDLMKCIDDSHMSKLFLMEYIPLIVKSPKADYDLMKYLIDTADSVHFVLYENCILDYYIGEQKSNSFMSPERTYPFKEGIFPSAAEFFFKESRRKMAESKSATIIIKL